MGDALPLEGGTYGIKGLPRPPNAVRYPGEIPYVKGLPVRKEISSLANADDPQERKQWTLFVLALERFKSMPVHDKLSYFQIAGIHGYPEVAWDGGPEPKHAQIDGLLDIWQCLNPKLWFDNGQSGDSDTAGITASSVTDDKETDPLEPFHKKDNDSEKEVWTAQACRDWTELNYQYDDLAEVAERTIRKYGRFISGEFQRELRSHINTIYPGTGHLIESMETSSNTPDGLRPNGLSYTIQFFIGGPPGEDTTNFEKHNYVGHVYSFGGRQSTSEGSCRNYKRQAEAQVLSCAQITLTIHLLHRIRDYVPDHSFEGVEKRKFSKLQISALRGAGRIKPGNAQSAGSVSSLHSEYVPLPEVTYGKPGWLAARQSPREQRAIHFTEQERCTTTPDEAPPESEI
ncbi:hypothetical protein FOYG_04124 [Fusarium oxysporum NRRL 32931]|uniref:Tyrosinase C-terminal domain-containing protein n=1 Tax=Fusarium oxysporum NRRL 32931 TaxID=660029 RepID=W9IK59_FUSOX|nr:hypothetical protein FOYG_04124 [Fusarium oxysporum NRRL 32931]